jgi:hypothetical protein
MQSARNLIYRVKITLGRLLDCSYFHTLLIYRSGTVVNAADEGVGGGTRTSLAVQTRILYKGTVWGVVLAARPCVAIGKLEYIIIIIIIIII